MVHCGDGHAETSGIAHIFFAQLVFARALRQVRDMSDFADTPELYILRHGPATLLSLR